MCGGRRGRRRGAREGACTGASTTPQSPIWRLIRASTPPPPLWPRRVFDDRPFIVLAETKPKSVYENSVGCILTLALAGWWWPLRAGAGHGGSGQASGWCGPYPAAPSCSAASAACCRDSGASGSRQTRRGMRSIVLSPIGKR